MDFRVKNEGESDEGGDRSVIDNAMGFIVMIFVM